MLRTMRNLAHFWVVKALMLILVVSFALWGIGDIFRGNPQQRAVAKIGDETITVQALQKGFKEVLAQARQTMGPDLTEQKARQLGLMENALDAMIRRTELNLQTKRLGIDVTVPTVLNWAAAQPELRNKDGSFNKELFRRLAERNHLGEADFIDKERESMAQHELLYAFENDSEVPRAMADLVLRARGQKRIFDVVALANDSVHDIPAPDEKILHDYYDKNPQSFTAPEYRALTVARLSLDGIGKDIVITDDQLKKGYESRIAQFTHPESRDILQVILQDQAKAKQLAETARAGGNLTDAASATGVKAVPLNQMEEKTLVPEIGKAVFTLHPGQISDPVKSPLGWHVFQLKKIAPAGTKTFDQVKDQLRETLKRDQAVDAGARIANKLDDELAAGHPLEDIVDGMKLRLVKIPAIDASGKTPEGKDPAELPDREIALKNGFGQNAGETSPLVDDRKGNYIIVRTDEVVPSAVRPFEKVKDQIAATWKVDEQASRAAAAAEKIARAIRDGKPPSSFAAQNGIEIRVSRPISLLGDNDAALPPSALPRILQMKKGEVITSSMPDHQIILRLDELIDVDAGDKSPARSRVTGEIGRAMPGELVEQYTKYLRVLFPPKIYHDVLDTMRQDGG